MRESALGKLGEFIDWAVENVGVWELRRVLILALEVDYACAIDHGIDPEEIRRFDEHIKSLASDYVRNSRRMRRDWR